MRCQQAFIAVGKPSRLPGRLARIVKLAQPRVTSPLPSAMVASQMNISARSDDPFLPRCMLSFPFVFIPRQDERQHIRRSQCPCQEVASTRQWAAASRRCWPRREGHRGDLRTRPLVGQRATGGDAGRSLAPSERCAARVRAGDFICSNFCIGFPGQSLDIRSGLGGVVWFLLTPCDPLFVVPPHFEAY